MNIVSNANESLAHSLDVIRANPIPIALIGIGVAWLIANNTGMTDRVSHTASDMGHRIADTASDVGRRAGELASDAAKKVGIAGSADRALGHTGHPMVDRDGEHREGWVHHMSEQASGALRSARDTSGAILHRVGNYAGAGGVSEALERNPLILGAIGVMTGALIAALVPMSKFENELFGDTRDELWQRAEDLGEEAVQRVRDAAAEAAVRAVDAAAGAVESVRQLGELGEKSSQS
jgi:hypothetical protein